MTAIIPLKELPKSCSECGNAIVEWAVVEVDGVDTKQFIYIVAL